MSLLSWVKGTDDVMDTVPESVEDGGISSSIGLQGGLSPYNTGKMDIYRSCPAVTEARQFNGKEAKKLQEQADKAEALAKATTEAYEALERISKADACVTQSYSRYAITESSMTLRAATAMTSYHNHLHQLRPGYFSLQESMQSHRDNANHRIEMLKEGLISRRYR